jgi:phenylalanyl-tRNA synthetase beta chain
VGYVAEVDPDLARSALGVPHSTGRIAVYELSADILLSLTLSDVRSYAPLPRFPSLSRDLAVVVGSDIPYASVADTARAAADPALLADLSLQSIYTGERIAAGKKSVALRFEFRAADRTLTDAEVNEQLALVEEALRESVGAEKR